MLQVQITFDYFLLLPIFRRQGRHYTYFIFSKPYNLFGSIESFTCRINASKFTITLQVTVIIFRMFNSTASNQSYQGKVNESAATILVILNLIALSIRGLNNASSLTSGLHQRTVVETYTYHCHFM